MERHWYFILGIFLWSLTPRLQEGLLAQAPVEAHLSRDAARQKLVPVFIHEASPEIHSQMQIALDELGQPFDREQIVDYSLSEILADELPELEKKILKVSKNPEDWKRFLRQIRNMRVRGVFNLRIHPQATQLDLAFKEPESDRAFASADGTLTASPAIEVLSFVGATLIEIDPKTGDERKIPFSTEVLSNALQIAKFQMPETKFKLSASIVDHFVSQADSEKPMPALALEIQSWESTFKNVVLPDSQVEPFIAKLLDGPVGFQVADTLMKTNAFAETFGDVANDSERSVLDREIKRQLDESCEQMVLWVERLPGGKIKPHLNALEKPTTIERIEKARAEGRLLFEAHSEISLSPQDFKVRYDQKTRTAQVTFVPKDVFTSNFILKSALLPNEWRPQIEDPLIKSILDQLYAKDFAQTTPGVWFRPQFSISGGAATVSLPVKWVDGAPQVDVTQVGANLEFLDQTFLDEIEFGWPGGENLRFQFNSTRTFQDQFLDQTAAIAKAHEAVLGPEFFKSIEAELLAMVEKEATQLKKQVRGTMSYDLQVIDFPIASEGKIICRYEKPKGPLNQNDAFRAFLNWPLGQKIPKDLIQQEGLMDLECEVSLPKKIDLAITNVKTPKADVTSIDFKLVAKGDEAPKVKTRWRLIRDETTGVLVALPLEMSIDEALKQYEIPETGPDSPVVGAVDPKGWKQTKKNAALVAGWLMRRAENVTGVPNGGKVVPAVVASLERGEVVQEIRGAIEGAAQSLRREVLEEAFKVVNGNVSDRRQLVLQQNGQFWWKWDPNLPFQPVPRDFVDPQKVDLGQLGWAQNWFGDRLGLALRGAQLDQRKAVGRIEIPDEGNLRSIVTQEVQETAVQTVENDPAGLTKISSEISNPMARQKISSLRAKMNDWLKNSVGRNYRQIETAIVNFIRGDQGHWTALEATMNDRLQKASTEETKINSEMMKLPIFCGFSVTQNKDSQGDQILSLAMNVKQAGVVRPFDFRRKSRPEKSANLDQILLGVDKENEIPLTISTDFLEGIANDPENIRRLEEAVRAQALTMKHVEKNFSIQFRDFKVRMNENGQSVVRVGVKVHQDARGFQKITSILGFLPDAILSGISGEKVTAFQDVTGAPGWVIDRISTPITEVDGFMTLEIPLNIEIDDYFLTTTDEHTQMGLRFSTDPRGVRVQSKKGWNTIFGKKAREGLVDGVDEIAREVFLKPLSIPGYEEHLTFMLGNEARRNDHQRYHGLLTELDPALSDEELLFKGVFRFIGRMKINPKSAEFPTFSVRAQPRADAGVPSVNR